MVSDRALITTVGIGSITILEAIALLKNIDGAILGTVVGAIGIIVGYWFKKK